MVVLLGFRTLAGRDLKLCLPLDLTEHWNNFAAIPSRS